MKLQNLTTENTEKKSSNYSAHLYPEGYYTREKSFYPQISKNTIQIRFNL